MTEAPDATDPEPWRIPVDALLEHAQARLQRDWYDYLKLIQGGWPRSFDDFARDAFTVDSRDARATRHAIRDARRRLLAGPQSLEPSWQKWEEIGRLNPGATDPEELERRIAAAEREPKLQLFERRFKDTMVDGLQSGRWEGEDLAGPIPGRIWSLPQLRVDWGNETIQIGEEPPRYGLRLRPRREVEAPPNQAPAEQSAKSGEISEAAGSGKKPEIEGALTDADTSRHTGATTEERPLARAELSEIRLALDELYDEDVIAAGFKPPSPREAGQRGKRLLLEWGRDATASRVEQIAHEPRYAERQLKRGEKFKR